MNKLLRNPQCYIVTLPGQLHQPGVACQRLITADCRRTGFLGRRAEALAAVKLSFAHAGALCRDVLYRSPADRCHSLLSCSANQTEFKPAAPSILGEWRVIALDGQPAVTGRDGRAPVLTFDEHCLGWKADISVTDAASTSIAPTGVWFAIG